MSFFVPSEPSTCCNTQTKREGQEGLRARGGWGRTIREGSPQVFDKLPCSSIGLTLMVCGTTEAEAAVVSQDRTQAGDTEQAHGASQSEHGFSGREHTNTDTVPGQLARLSQNTADLTLVSTALCVRLSHIPMH